MIDTPPQSLEAEEAVIGACLLGSRSVWALEQIEDLEAAHFYRPSNGMILEAARTVAREGAVPDPVTVTDALRKAGHLESVGGPSRIAELAALVPAASNIAHYAEIVKEMSFLRIQLEVSKALAKVATNGGLTANPDVQRQLRALLEPATRGLALEALNLTELLAGPIPTITWSWNTWVAHDDLVLVVGDPGVGKSYMTLALAMAMREGREFLGAKVMERRCGIIDLENPYADVLVRLHSLGMRHEDTFGLSYFHMPYLNLTSPAGARTVEQTIVENGLGMLVLDSFRRLCPGVNENDSGEVTDVLQPLVEICRRRTCNIMLIHHAKKRQENAPTDAGSRNRGSTAFQAVADVQLFLNARPGKASVFTLEHGKNRHGPEREPIQVHIEADEEGGVAFVSSGEVATSDDRVDRYAEAVVDHLAANEYGATRAELARALNTSPANRDFRQAIKLVIQRAVVVEHKKARGAASAFVHVQHDRRLDDGPAGSNVIPLHPEPPEDDAPPDDRPPLGDDDIPF